MSFPLGSVPEVYMEKSKGSEEELIRALENLLSLAYKLHKGVHVCGSGCEDAFEDAELLLEKRRFLTVRRNGGRTR